jgi:hypothetical protein
VNGGFPAVWRGSVASQIRLLIGVLVILVPIGAIISVATIQSQSKAVRALTLALGPATEANNAVLLGMTRAESSWHEVTSGRRAHLDPFSLENTVRDDLARVASGTQSRELNEADRTRFAVLLDRESDAVAAWFSSARAALKGRPANAALPEAQRTQTETAYAALRWA